MVKNLKNNTQKVLRYNAIMVCNGHYSNPRIPVIEGQDTFEGLQMHSMNYRVNDIYKDKNLLVIGFAYSGQDTADDTSKVAKKVFLSHHSEDFKAEYFRNTIIPKPEVKKINRNSVTFEDGTTENIDAILYCTGYLYTFPFLDESCGISVDDNYMKPLHRQFINIIHPSMAFIGLPSKTFVFPLLEVQVRAFVKLLLGQAGLPTENKMWEELQRFESLKIEKGIPKRKYHQLESVSDYVHKLNSIADLENLPLVL